MYYLNYYNGILYITKSFTKYTYYLKIKLCRKKQFLQNILNQMYMPIFVHSLRLSWDNSIVTKRISERRKSVYVNSFEKIFNNNLKLQLAFLPCERNTGNIFGKQFIKYTFMLNFTHIADSLLCLFMPIT